MRNFIKISIVCVLSTVVPHIQLTAQDYITQQQLDSATVVDLPGRIGADYARERDPENMAANAVSKIGGLMSTYTGLTLGMVGGIATLGFLGVLSAPVAIISAAAVGGLALVGAVTEGSRHTPRGLSTQNFGHLGMGRPNVYGARSNSEGIMGGVFGWTDEVGRSRYPIGSIGVSSGQRAPVHVNMQAPHVLGITGRGYDFMNYDSGYTNMNPVAPNMAGMAVSPSAGMAVPFSPGNSNQDAPSSASSSPSAPYFGAPGYGNPYISNMHYGNHMNSWGYGQLRPQTHYDRRGGNTFSNFFQRIDNAGVSQDERGTRGTVDPRRNVYFQGPSPYSYNWQRTSGAPDNYLSQSFEYQQSGQWRATSPQGRTMPPHWHGGINQIGPAPSQPQQTQPVGGSAAGSTQLAPNYQGGAAASGFGAGMPVNPMNFQFGAPRQGMDFGVAHTYPMGNAYQNPALPNTFDRNFSGYNQNLNQGYQPNALGLDAGYQYQNFNPAGFPANTGNTNPQLRDDWGVTPMMTNGAIAPAEETVRPVAQINTVADPTALEEQAAAQVTAQQSVINNQKSLLSGAMAPGSSGFDPARLAELEQERQEVYKQLLKAMQLKKEEEQKEHFDRYQELTEEINNLKN